MKAPLETEEEEKVCLEKCAFTLQTAANLLSSPPTYLSCSLLILPSCLSSSCVYSSSGWIHHQEGPLLREWPNLSDAVLALLMYLIKICVQIL